MRRTTGGVRFGLCLAWALLGAASARAADGAAPYPTGLGLTEVEAWLKAQTDIPPDTLVGISQGRAFAASPDGRGASEPGVTALTVTEAALTPEAAAALHGRSARLQAQVRCADRSVRLGPMKASAGVRSDSPPRAAAPTGAWTPAPAGSTAELIVQSACPAGAATPAIAVAASSPAEPPSAEPKAVAEASTTDAPPAIEPTSRAKPALRPRAGAHGVVAQIGAYPSAADAQAAWRRAKVGARPDAGELTLRTEPVKSGGRTLYRALVEGFASVADARGFCATQKAAGRPCLVR